MTQREKIVEIALGEVGVSGKPNKYTYWYGSSGGSYSYAWCGVFISWCAAQAGIPDSVIHRTASAVCNSFEVPYYKYTSDFNVQPGDILYVDNNVTLHAGLVVAVDSKYIYTVEGNMSNSVKKVCYERSSGYTDWSSSYEWQRILYVGVPAYPDDIAKKQCGIAYYNGNRYVVYDCSVKWSKAKQLCKDLGGHLAVITSEKENAVVKSLVTGCGKNCWIGASDIDKEGSWKWVTSEPFKYKAWASGQPNNGGSGQDCAAVNGKSGLWQDDSASSAQLFVCEFEDCVKLTNSFYLQDNNHTYEYYAEALTWSEARDFCAKKGGHLLTVAQLPEQQKIKSFIEKIKKAVWAGANVNNSTGRWCWITGEIFDYTNWDEKKIASAKGAGTSLEICADAKWSEASASKRQGFICEYDHTHRYGTPTLKTKASLKADGALLYKCACGNSYTKTFGKISSVKLSKTEYTYNGEVRKPTVTVKDSAGKKLTENKDYTVKYASGRKNPGTYKVTVTFKGYYTGTVTESFSIYPPKTSITSAKPGNGKVTLKLKAVNGISGYEIWYYSTAYGKYVKDGSTKETSYSFSGLQSGKTYKLKVRTYKTVSGVKYYSAFSAVKKVKSK